ncbi:CBM35 domain-containing protein [Streptomyces sp. NPDC088923]|uniref:CBM35 domain-containing protein n=1 Tax=Streptomyces sp. NPDC088923 TaxID=3365913 RepID=UPI00381B464A
MTPGPPGNNGANPPEGENPGAAGTEEDDPFGYLYADGQSAGARPPSGGGYGYPGQRSHHQVRAVGERQYGYGYPPKESQQSAPGQGAPTAAYPQQQNAHYAAPENLPGGPPAGGGRRAANGQGGGRGGGRGRGPNNKGLLIGAVAVVCAVAVGITVAVVTGGSGDDKQAAKDPAPSATASEGHGGEGDDKQPGDDASKEPVEELPKADAKTLQLSGGPSVASDVEGAKADGGSYVAGFNKPGAKLTWNVSVPKAGEYTVFLDYGVPGKDQQASLYVNGGDRRDLSLKNWAQAPEGDWEKGWTTSYVFANLTKGTNAISFSCDQGDSCDANFDRVWLKAGHVTK